MLSKEVIKEIRNIAICIACLTIVMLIVFLILGYLAWDAIFGALMGSVVALLNFVFLAFAVEKSVKDGKNPKMVVASSYTLRMLFIAVMIVVAIKSPYINYIAMVIPLVFPRISIMIINFLKKRTKNERTEDTF